MRGGEIQEKRQERRKGKRKRAIGKGGRGGGSEGFHQDIVSLAGGRGRERKEWGGPGIV